MGWNLVRVGPIYKLYHKVSYRMEIYASYIIWILLHLSLVDLNVSTGTNYVECDPTKDNSCPRDYCCVKEVYVSMDVTKPAKGFTICKRKLQKDDFCLHKTEGFLCDCDKGLKCVSKEAEDNFGHCRHA